MTNRNVKESHFEQNRNETECFSCSGTRPSHILGKVGKRPNVFWAQRRDRIWFWCSGARPNLPTTNRNETESQIGMRSNLNLGEEKAIDQDRMSAHENRPRKTRVKGIPRLKFWFFFSKNCPKKITNRYYTTTGVTGLIQLSEKLQQMRAMLQFCLMGRFETFREWFGD
jgi:hypothetical protein